ncbi:TetR/AcrR family transcriptional regulator [Limibacter armeniacum]|uniref:TetR/AcrR family transcriptional regulator n=1 Tax=Limibacter armeniacum TaxID=466084 RepID=UPI002FE6B72D
MNKREMILQAAVRLLVDNGIHATPMSMIAKEAQTGMGTIYNYFESKEILINEIYRTIKHKEKVVLEASFHTELPVKLQFEQFYRSMVMFFVENTLYFRFLEQLQTSPIITDESEKEGYEAVECVMQLLERGKREYIIKDIDTDKLLQFIGGAIFSYLRWLNKSGNTVTLEKTMETQLRLVWDGIRA